VRGRIIDAWAARGEGAILLIGRILIGALYLPGGYRHLADISGFAKYLGSTGLLGPAVAWAVVAAIVEFFGGLAIVLGVATRYAALLLVAFTVIAALLAHQFWAADAAAYRLQYIQFWKNIAITGGLLFVFVRGAGPLSIDRK
jgi:putative oxidoreductase